MAEVLAFVFPGQGSQYVGMGKKIYDSYPEAREIFYEAEQILSKNVKSICFKGPEVVLNRTANTQVAVFVTSCAYLSVLEKREIFPKMVAGHSLGEYSALVAAKVLSFSEALRLVNLRAQFMQECAEKHPGKMIAVLGLEREKIEKIITSLKNEGIVGVANYNSPGQIVVSGEVKLIDQVAKRCLSEGAKKVVELKVSGAFHSPLMKEANIKLLPYLEKTNFRKASFPLVSNTTASFSTSPDEVREALKTQIVSSVLWEDSVRFMIREGANVFVEVGPGRVLSNLIRRIEKEVSCVSCDDDEDFERFLSKMAQGG